jgi:hypothetical protein
MGEHADQPSNWVYSTVGNLKYTTAFGFSSYANATYPDSFSQGIRSNDTTDYLMF